MSITEDTITDRIASYLRKKKLSVDTQRMATLRSGRKRKPDLWIENHGIFLGEAEWKSSETKGWAQAHDFFACKESTASFLIIYPDQLREELSQERLTTSRESLLKEFEYEVSFLTEEGTDMRTVTLEELPSWLEESIYRKRKPEPDLERVIDTLQLTVRRLTGEIGDVTQFPDLFRNVIGSGPETGEVAEAVRDAAAYLLVNQIAFYRVLSEERDDLPDLDPNAITNPASLEKYFSKVLDIDYSPVFAPSVAPEFSMKSLNLIRETIKVIYSLKPETVSHDILGKVFHNLIPLSIRKNIAAFYTLNKPAELLTNLSIDTPEASVLDPACGSGTFLVTSYRRKKELKERKGHFTEADHRRFLEQEITGIDIMPFAAHLSTIHLALQAPLFETDKVRIGIGDSTKLYPSETIPSLSGIVPEAERQRTLEDFKEEIERVERGVVDIDHLKSQEIDLTPVDLVIMNPPFTRQETMADFSAEYKDKLEKRLQNYTDLIDRRMSYCSYFLLLADKFTKEGGKIASVLPATFLRKETDKKVRRYLFDNYSIPFIIIREDQLNFSEETFFREILFLAEKNEKNKTTTFVILREFPSTEKVFSSIKKLNQKVGTGETIEKKGIELRKFKRENLSPRNLFQYVATSDYNLFNIWNKIKQSPSLNRVQDIFDTIEDESVKRGEVDIKRGVETARGGSIQAMSINYKGDRERLRKGDKWIVQEEKKESIVAKHRFTDEEMKIPIDAVTLNLRRFAGIRSPTITQRKEYIIKDNFEGIRKYLGLAKNKTPEKVDLEFLPNWKEYVEDRASHLHLARRLHGLSAEGTACLALYSDKKRTPPGVMWSVRDISEEKAKTTCLWFNSTFNILQILIERVGTWMELHKYILKEMLSLDYTKLDKREKKGILDTFNEVKDKTFPCIWKQLAMNAEKKEFTEEEIDELDAIFDGFKEVLGEGFSPRKNIDETILNLLELKNEKKILQKLYCGLLKEIAMFKKMM